MSIKINYDYNHWWYKNNNNITCNNIIIMRWQVILHAIVHLSGYNHLTFKFITKQNKQNVFLTCSYNEIYYLTCLIDWLKAMIPHSYQPWKFGLWLQMQLNGFKKERERDLHTVMTKLSFLVLQSIFLFCVAATTSASSSCLFSPFDHLIR